MDGFERFCAQSDERKEAEKKRFRLACQLDCLMASLSRIDQEDFDETMNRIEKVKAELWAVTNDCIRLRYEEAKLDTERRMSGSP